MAVRLNLMHERFETDDLECKRFFCVQFNEVVFFDLSLSLSYFIEA